MRIDQIHTREFGFEFDGLVQGVLGSAVMSEQQCGRQKHSNKRYNSKHTSFYFAEQGVGFQPEASGSFLKFVLVVNDWLRYCGSSTIVVTTSHSSPFGPW